MAADTVYLPCPDYKPGNSWRFSEQSSHFPSENVTTVLSVDGDSIVVGEVKKITPVPDRQIRGTIPAAQQQTQMMLLRRGNTVYRTAFSMEMAQTGQVNMKATIGPEAGMHECGDLPRSASYEQTMAMMGQTSGQQITIVNEPVGRKKVRVPAGDFDTVVVKRVATTSAPSIPGRPSPPAPTVTSVYYAAEGVGTVKIEISIETVTPVFNTKPSAEDPAIQAAMNEGLEAMQKGEDPSAAMAKMQALAKSKEQAGAMVPEMRPSTMTNTVELVSYALK